MTIASHFREAGPRAQRADDRVFRSAVRHSRYVRFMRIGIPVGIAVAVLAVAGAATWLDPLRRLAKLPIDIGGVVVSGTKITMQQPRLTGFTRDSRPYEVTAKAAAQDVTNPDKLELRDINAKIQRPDKTTITITARNGFYDTKVETLLLQQDIVVTSSTGEQSFLSEAAVDVRKGYILSEKPVEVRMLRGTVNSNRLEIFDSGDLVRFDHGVTMTVIMEGGMKTNKP